MPLVGTGGAAGTTAAISFNPRSVAFTPLHVGKTSKLWTVNVSNAGGTLPLDVQSVTLNGTGAAQFAVVENRCTANVAAGRELPGRPGLQPDRSGELHRRDAGGRQRAGNRHTLALSGTGTNANPAVSAALDSDNHYPRWYQDSTGTRVEACLNIADPNCVVLGDQLLRPEPAGQVFPSNFPGEFFYGLADSEQISTPGCGGTAPGTAQLRVSMEGSFANAAPADGDQITFARLRSNVTSGLCPNTPYVRRRRTGRSTSPPTPPARYPATPAPSTSAAPRSHPPPATSPRRWPPTAASPRTATPTRRASCAGTPRRHLTGRLPRRRPGVPQGHRRHLRADRRSSQPVNKFAIFDTAGNVVGQTDTFTVSGKLAGPLQSDVASVDFGHQPGRADQR